ncbi:MAG TPA: CHRD domain-containing protein [Caulobacteraceae bacterium]
MYVRAMAATAALVVLSAGGAHAALFNVSATLKGASEVPANTTTGTGTVSATLDTGTKSFSYSVRYSGLTGPAIAAHFHGPAAPGANAPPIITIANLTSPILGTTSLTDAQIADLKAGKWYFNVHTAAHPGGEIRGQLRATPK